MAGELMTSSPIAIAAMVKVPGVKSVIGSVYKIESPESLAAGALAVLPESTIE